MGASPRSLPVGRLPERSGVNCVPAAVPSSVIQSFVYDKEECRLRGLPNARPRARWIQGQRLSQTCLSRAYYNSAVVRRLMLRSDVCLVHEARRPKGVLNDLANNGCGRRLFGLRQPAVEAIWFDMRRKGNSIAW